jgi:hypothetical protein
MAIGLYVSNAPISAVIGFLRKIVGTIGSSNCSEERQLHTSTISALNACIDERIEPLSPDKLRGIVTLKVKAGAT